MSSTSSSLLTRTLADRGMDLASWMSSSICCNRAVMSTGDLPSLSAGEPVLQPLLHERREQAADVAAEPNDLLDERRRQVRPLGAGGDQERLHPRHPVVHL